MPISACASRYQLLQLDVAFGPLPPTKGFEGGQSLRPILGLERGACGIGRALPLIGGRAGRIRLSQLGFERLGIGL